MGFQFLRMGFRLGIFFSIDLKDNESFLEKRRI